MQPKRILHLYSSWTAGGAEKIMLSLALHLEKQGFANIIAAPRDSYLFRQAGALGLAAYAFSTRGSFDPFGLMRLGSIVRRENIDLLHAHQGKVFWPCVFMKWLSGGRTKLVFHRHAHLPHRFYSRNHYRWADRVIAISQVVARDLIERERVSPEKVRVVYNGTDFARFSPDVSGAEVRKEFGLEGRTVIGTVAAMNRPRGKGQEYLLRAAQQLKDRFPGVSYLVVGDGPLRRELEKNARELGVADRVVFTGYREDVERYIAAMDVFCFLSWDTEGFGQVMVEAQAAGKPVIGTDVGGIPETFENGTTGYLIKPMNTDMLVKALIPLVENPGKRHGMGAAAREFVAGRFGIGAMVEGTIRVYREAFHGQG